MISHKRLVQSITFICFILLGHTALAQLAISEDGSAPDSSSMLHVKSIDKGLLTPRMSTIQRTAINNPANGLLVYDSTTNSFWFFKPDLGWKEITSSYWSPDSKGIYFSGGKVGIGTPASNPSNSSAELTVNGAIEQYSDDPFQTVVNFRNTTNNQMYQLNLAGANNIDYAPRSFGIYNNNLMNWLWNSDGRNSYLAIGSYTYKQEIPRSRLHIFNGDVNVNDIGRGIIMKSPNGQCWRVTVSDTGSFVSTAIVCP